MKITFEDEAYDSILTMLRSLEGFCVKITYKVPPTRGIFIREAIIDQLNDNDILTLGLIDADGQETGEELNCNVLDIIEIHVL